MAASLVFLTPWGALLLLAALIPLLGLSLASHRERRGRELVGLPAPPPARRLSRAVAVAAVPMLLGLAATQPALQTTAHARVRTDAQALFVLDVSRSMLASRGPTGRTRLARAKSDALAIRSAIPDVPAGVATLTDRVVPNLLPVPDPAVFQDTVKRAVQIEQPPPSSTDVVATSLAALGAVGTQNFFPPSARRRVVVVLTDGESGGFDPRQVARALSSGPGVRLIFVHVSASGESVYAGGRLEPSYREDAASGRALETLASASGGASFGEDAVGAAARAVEDALGRGPTVERGVTQRTRTLAPFVALVALVPLLFVVWPGLVSLRSATRTIRPVPARPVRTNS